MKDGSDAIADWPILNALLNTAAGAHWVSFHHGGGVGIGYSLHAGMVVVADGSDDARERLCVRAYYRSRTRRRSPCRRRLRSRHRNRRRRRTRLAPLIVPSRLILSLSNHDVAIRRPLRNDCSCGKDDRHLRYSTLRNAASTLTRSAGSTTPRCSIEDGVITVACGHPASVTLSCRATLSAVEGRSKSSTCGDCVVVPGFVDAHAHPLYAGNREPDFAARTRGEPPPLGMRYTIEQTREALLDPEAFYEGTLRPQAARDARARHDDARNQDGLRAA